MTEDTHFRSKTVAETAQPTPELSDRGQVEAEYVNTVLPLMEQWESSLLEQWGVTLTPRLREDSC